MNEALKKAGRTVYHAYFLSVLLAAPYFNWRYATEHGFMGWLFFGEFVATGQSLIWPYYAVAGFGHDDQGPSRDTDVHFANSRRDSNEALRRIDRLGGLMELKPEDAVGIARLLQASVSEAELVDDKYLERVHPEFLRRFRDGYTASLRSFADGILAGDLVKQKSAATAYNDFSDWMRDHAVELTFP